jgi:hypothetical protein
MNLDDETGGCDDEDMTKNKRTYARGLVFSGQSMFIAFAVYFDVCLMTE